MLEQLPLVGLGELAIMVDAGSVLDLIPGYLSADILPIRGSARQRHEIRLGAEQAAGHRRPLRLTGTRVFIDLADLADRLAIAADDRPSLPLVCIRHFRHGPVSLLETSLCNRRSVIPFVSVLPGRPGYLGQW